MLLLFSLLQEGSLCWIGKLFMGYVIYIYIFIYVTQIEGYFWYFFPEGGGSIITNFV